MPLNRIKSLKGKKILVIDDVESDRMLVFTHLRHFGCRVYLANDGIDGIHKARLIGPDVILMDVDMPKCNGYDACKLILNDSKTRHIPVIFLSAYASEEDRVRGLTYGAVDYIAKPFSFDEVKLRLSIHLESRGCGGSRVDRQNEEVAEVEHVAHDSPQPHLYLHEILFHSARVQLLKSLEISPGLQELANSVGTNTKLLNEAFRVCSGLTVYGYLREERMKEAARLLISTRMPVTSIAASVGFSSVGSFSTAFKERFRMPPSLFRRSRGIQEND